MVGLWTFVFWVINDIGTHDKQCLETGMDMDIENVYLATQYTQPVPKKRASALGTDSPYQHP